MPKPISASIKKLMASYDSKLIVVTTPTTQPLNKQNVIPHSEVQIVAPKTVEYVAVAPVEIEIERIGSRYASNESKTEDGKSYCSNQINSPKSLALEMRLASECQVGEPDNDTPEIKARWAKLHIDLVPLMMMEAECESVRKMKEGKLKKQAKIDLLKRLWPLVPAFDKTPELLDFQIIALPRAIRILGIEQRGYLGIKPTGSGKTFFTGYMIRILRKYFAERYSGQIMLVTKPTLTIQTIRVVCHQFNNNDVFVLSYQQVATATLSDLYIAWKTELRGNPPAATQVAKWDVDFKPCLLILDEVQCLKNDSTQSGVFREFAIQCTDDNGIPTEPEPVVWAMSATPYSRPRHLKSVCCLIKPRIKYAYGWRQITADNFNDWVRDECAHEGCTPDEWNEKAMGRIQRQIEYCVGRFDKIHYKKRTLIKQQVIEFDTEERRLLYENAYLEWLEKMAEAEASGGNILVEIQQFRMKSELLRADVLAQNALNTISLGRSVIIATAFRQTLEEIKRMLISAGVKPELIAEVKGGQSKSQRQTYIDEFQSDTRHIMLLMFSAGGAGLSLHQNDKENKRQRVVYLPPVWNAEELVQVLGRAHRVNSDSTTYQYIIWYRGTIEETVAEKVKKKCSSLRQVVGDREDWTTAFAGRKIGAAYKTHDEEGNEYDDDDEPPQYELPIATCEEDLNKPMDEDDNDNADGLVNAAN